VYVLCLNVINELQQVYTNIPHIGVKYLTKILESSCLPGCKPDESRRLYRMGAMDGRKRFYLYYTRDVFVEAPELEQQMEQTKKVPMPEDEDIIGPEVDPLTIKKGHANGPQKSGTVSNLNIIFLSSFLILFSGAVYLNP